jgi:E3 ubiquitin-protein ligase TRIP12
LIEQRTVELPEIVAQFRTALSTVVQWEFLNLFSPAELCILLEGQNPRISRADFLEAISPSHGYSHESVQEQMLAEVVDEMDELQQALLVGFLTGTNRLPFGGLKALSPPLTVAPRAPVEGQWPDETLPSVMTCANYFKIPEYSSKAILKEKLLIAIHEGQGAFLLT